MLEDAVSAFGVRGITWAPASSAWEDASVFYVQVALPRWEPQDVSLEVAKHVLSIKDERKEPSESARTVHVKEIGDGRFIRLFRLPTYIDSENASAVQRNGLLTVTFRKREEAKSRRIMIEGT